MMNILLKRGLVIDYKNNYTKRVDIYIENGIVKEISENINKDADRIIDCIGLVITPSFIDLYCKLDDERKIDVSRSSLYSATMGGYTTLCVHGKYKDYEKNICDIIDIDRLKENDNKTEYILELTQDFGINDSEIAKQIDIDGVNPDEETINIEKALIDSQKNNKTFFINKITTKKSVELIRNAKRKGVKVYCSTCPQYYSFTVNSILEAGVNAKTNPPLRTEEDRLAIIEGIHDGTIDCIVTDNTPVSEDAKSVGIALAPSGVVGFETALSSVLTSLMDLNKVTYKDLVKLLSYNPAKILGIDRGTLEVGKAADIVIFDPSREFVFAKDRMASLSKNSPWINKHLRGHVRFTIFNGKIVYERSKKLIK